MAALWTAPQKAAFRDAYLDWDRLIARRRATLLPDRPERGTEWEPAFVRLAPGDALAQRRTLAASVDAPDTPLRMDPHERGFLQARIDAPEELADLPDEHALYRRFGTPDSDHATLFEVLDTGLPVLLTEGEAAAAPAPLAPSEGQPIVALIDDGIGFLNTRFARAENGEIRTRIRAIWLQALESRAEAGQVLAGKVLTGAEIDARIGVTQRRTEGDVYDAVNAEVYGFGARRATAQGRSHGSHVLDLAAGAEPDGTEPARDWPLLAVQLPPEAVEDTSGTRFESYMVQGFRWILRNARQIDPAAPVIVNLSMGMIAGPKDGTRFAELQIAREAQAWQAATGQTVRVVWAFGNAYRARLVARMRWQDADARGIDWCVQPGDQTPSYLEIHTRDGAAPEVALTAPDGTESGFVPLAPDQIRTLAENGRALARIYHVPARDFGGGAVCPAHCVLALAPTEGREAGEPQAEAGVWRVALRPTGAGMLDVTLQVQRDDALRGARAQARQSFLDGPEAHVWDPDRQDWRGIDPAGPICTAGAHNALVTASGPISAGAAWDAADLRPADYTSEGAEWSVPGPDVSAIADEGGFLWGALGAGTTSGAVRRMNGTSAAAGRITRALALTGGTLPPAGTAENGVEMVALPPAQHARLGPVLSRVPPHRPARG
jgi:hypothetical protein